MCVLFCRCYRGSALVMCPQRMLQLLAAQFRCRSIQSAACCSKFAWEEDSSACTYWIYTRQRCKVCMMQGLQRLILFLFTSSSTSGLAHQTHQLRPRKEVDGFRESNGRTNENQKLVGRSIRSLITESYDPILPSFLICNWDNIRIFIS